MTEAERTGRGISLEDLTGIRERVRHRKPQRVALHSWAFAQLADFIVYKARRAGVPVVFVDPAWSSSSAPSAGTSTGSTGSLKHCSLAGAAASLRTRTGTLPASWPEEARTRGMRGGSHTSRPPAHPG